MGNTPRPAGWPTSLAAVFVAAVTVLALLNPSIGRVSAASVDANDGRDASVATGAGIPPLGLRRADPGGQCRHLPYEVRTTRGTACTHGPDPAPKGINVWSARSITELRDDAQKLERSVAPTTFRAAEVPAGETAATLDQTTGTVPCVGFGTSGPRVIAIYAYQQGNTNRYSAVAPLIQQYAGTADAIYDESAAETGGSRHLRWEHDADCNPVVHQIALSQTAAADLSTMESELWNAGYNHPDERYVVWFDVSGYGICGVALVDPDDSPGQGNRNNGYPLGYSVFSRIDEPCWGRPSPTTFVEAHEITHTLGAVMASSPNTSSTVDVFYGHCIDDYDEMCYQDGTPKTVQIICTDQAHEQRLDCNHDDYFSTNPPAGSYLTTHWNTANSIFLVTVDPVGGFLDVDASPFKADIGWLQASGITGGCSSSGEQFCPAANVTRGQMAAFLDRALHLPTTTTDFFTDDETSPFEPNINRLAAAGITSGCGGSKYCPNATITREQMAAYLDRALHLAATSTDFFTDDGSSPFQANINRTAAAGITSGCGGGRYCPSLLVTREQMAAFLHRAFG